MNSVNTSLDNTGKSSRSPSWNFEKKDQGWKTRALAEKYFYNSHPQLDWALTVLSKFHPFQGNEHVMDFGCGDGKITSFLSRFVPKGEVVGYDLSDAMIDFAKTLFSHEIFPNLSYKALKDNSFTNSDPYIFDLAVSFCVLHLVKDPATVLRNINAKLKPGGKFLTCYPIQPPAAFFKAANETFDKFGLQTPWSLQSGTAKESKEGFPSTWDPECMCGILEREGFQVEKMERIETKNPFINKERLLDWFLGTFTANWNISENVQNEFFSCFVDLYLEKEEGCLGENGVVFLKYARLDLLAYKKPN